MKDSRPPEHMRLLHVVHYFLPHHFHGTEQATYHLARAQMEAGHRVAVVAGERGRFHRELTFRRRDYKELEVWRIYFNPRTRNAYLGHVKLERAFQSFLDSFRPDLIHIQHLATLSHGIVRVAREKGIPVVMTLHDYHLVCPRIQLLRGDGTVCDSSDLQEECLACLNSTMKLEPPLGLRDIGEVLLRNLGRKRSWFGLLTRMTGLISPAKAVMSFDSVESLRNRNAVVNDTLANVQRILAPSADLARRFEQFAGLKEGHVIPLHHTVNIDCIPFLPRKAPQLPLRVGYVGKISYMKGLHVLLEALRKLDKGLTHVDVFGAPTWTSLNEVGYYRRMRKLAKGLPVTFHPRGFAPERVGEVFSGFDLLVIPSVWYENSPLVVGEAFASGLPVICPDKGGPAELVRDGVDGRHFRHRDPGSLAAVLHEIAHDPYQVKELSANVIRPQPPSAYIQEVESIYRQALAEGNLRSPS